MAYKKNDYLVYPGHGVGKVTSVEKKEIFGRKQDFIHIALLSSGMKVLVPKDNLDATGIRPLAKPREAKKAIEAMRDHKPIGRDQTWNMRYRELMERIKGGNLAEMLSAYKDLISLANTGELSFGERKMRDTLTDLLVTELGLSLNMLRAEVETCLIETANGRS